MADRVSTLTNSTGYTIGPDSLNNYASNNPVRIQTQAEFRNPDCQSILDLQLNAGLNETTRRFYEFCEADPPLSNQASNPNTKFVSFFVNGILNEAESSAASAELLAQTLGRPVYRVHNDSEYYGAKDLVAAGVGLISEDGGSYLESSVQSLAEQIAFRLQDDPRAIVDLHAHSQGSIIVANALNYLRTDILQITDNSEWQALVNSRLKVTTYGAAEHNFAEVAATEYKHRFDPVPNSTGIVTYVRDKIANWLRDAPGNQINTTARVSSLSHSFDTYIRDYPDFFVAQNSAALDNGSIAQVIKSSILKGDFSDKTHNKIIDETLNQLIGSSGDRLYEFARDLLRYERAGALGDYSFSAVIKRKLLKTTGDLD